MIKYYPFKCELVWKNLPYDKLSQYDSIKRAASISYGKESSKTPEEFVKMIIKKGHHSVLEHTDIKLIYRQNMPDKDFIEWKEANCISKHLFIHRSIYDTFIIGNLRAFYDTIKFMIPANNHINLPILIYIKAFLVREFPEIFQRDISDKVNSAFLNKEEKVLFLNFDEPWFDRFCFYIECSRNISMQILRHRSLSFNQESQRYVDYSEELPICLWQGYNNDTYKSMINIGEIDYYEELQHLYSRMIDENFSENAIKKEQARGVLPGDMKTRLYITGCREDFENFIKLRDSKHAQPEIRWIAQQIKYQIK